MTNQDGGRTTHSRARRRAAAVGSLSLSCALLVGVGAAAASSVPSSPELFGNTGFETGTSGWNAPSAELRRVAGGHSGGFSARVSAPTRRTVVLNDTPNSVASSTAGTTYDSSAWVRTATPPMTVQFRQREVRNGLLVASSSSQVPLTDTAWHRVSVQHTAKASGSTLDLNTYVPDLAVGKSFQVDDASVKVLPPVVVAAPVLPPVPAPCAVDAKLVPSCGALWGGYIKPGAVAGGTDWASSYTAMESVVGRKIAITKRYHDWSGVGGNGAFPDASERSLADGGRILHFAWTSKSYSGAPTATWRDIADGKYDATIVDPEAQRIKAFGKKVFLDFDHEMDGVTRTTNGTPADYVAAHRHLYDRFKAIGASNVSWVWTPTGSMGNIAKIAASYPGDAYVDWIAYDPYNFASCNGTAWKDFSTTVDPFYKWLMANGHGNKPFMLGEYGSAAAPTDPSARAAWFQGQVAGMKAHPNIKAVQYWNSGTSMCNLDISRDVAGLSAWGAAGRDAYFDVKQ